MADDGSPVDGGRSAQNAAMLDTLFLYGGSAVWIEQMQAKYAANPNSVPESWRAFFEELGDGSEDAARNADGASWKRRQWPSPSSPEETAAFDGNWTLLEPKLEKKIKSAAPAASTADVERAVKDSVKALMMIRAFRMRGHLQAQLDPLGLENPDYQPELDPKNYGFEEADLDREIFIDGVLGLEHATVRQILD
ncbi:MAG: 2-oxoglutarate dehydrogenase E1 component, partial [Alphaproteobacteria bacterium]|nr:2-oxoglutarate dehydrogenase E1 component [Alphaproteobacteria bacterium]